LRPPAEESHYHRAASSALANELLAVLSQAANAVVIFSPRYDWQVKHLEALSWLNTPVVLHEAVPFLRLLGAADLVVSGGGTMLREAAYLGVPAYSLFQGSPGAVDRHLSEIGRLVILKATDDFAQIHLQKREQWTPLRSNATASDDIARLVLARMGSPAELG
jgi:predicted glycosyltransferase